MYNQIRADAGPGSGEDGKLYGTSDVKKKHPRENLSGAFINYFIQRRYI